MNLESILEKEQINSTELKYLLDNTPYTIVLDVRSDLEYINYHIPKAKHFPINELSLEHVLKTLDLTKNSNIVLVTYCNAGGRGGRSFTLLNSENTKPTNIKIKNLTHGINEWIDLNYKIER